MLESSVPQYDVSVKVGLVLGSIRAVGALVRFDVQVLSDVFFHIAFLIAAVPATGDRRVLVPTHKPTRAQS